MRAVLLALTALALAGCPKTAAGPACGPGESNRCSCAGGGEGLQQCLPSGQSFGACVCSDVCANGASCAAVPNLLGMDMDQAGAAVDGAGLRLPDPVDAKGFITVQQIADPPVQVLAQSPAPGTPVTPGTRLTLTVTLPPDQESLGLPNSNFLVGHLQQDTEQSARTYYEVLDPGPFPTRSTFADWKAANGFGTAADAEASAIYMTHTDLGFGRHMHMRRKGRRVAFYVDNYPTIEDAIAGTKFFATVAMEYSPGPNGSDGDPFFTQFYVFDKKGQRITDPILDDHGPKQSPAVCVVCHGGNVTDLAYAGGGNLHARFIPFDLDAEEFLDRPSFRRSDQEAAFKAFNEAVALTWQDAAADYPAGDPPPVPELVDKWYGGAGHPSPTFLSGVTPDGWNGSLEARDLYHQVFARSCQTCHAQRESFRNFSTFDKFNGARGSGLIEQRVFKEGAMPLSERGFLNFWLSYPNQPKILADWLGTRLSAPGKPIARVQVSPSTVVTSGTTVTFDASDSQYAEGFDWRQTAGNAVQIVGQTVSGSRVSFVAPPRGSNLSFELRVAVLGRTSDPVPLAVLSRSPPDPPASLVVTPGAGSAAVQWTAPAFDGLSPVTGYTVTVTPGGGTVSTTATSTAIDSLQSGITYTFAVAAVNAIGTGAPATTSLRIPTKPDRPASLTAVSTHAGKTLSLGWTPPADTGGAPLTGYTATCSPSGSATAAGNATGVLVAGLDNGTPYSCTVLATNVAGDGPPSLPASATPDGPPAPPTGFIASSAGGANWDLSWNAPADTGGVALTGYVATWTPATGVPSRTLPTNPTSVTLGAAEGLVAGTTYTFSLSATNAFGPGAAATTTPPGKPVITSPAGGASTGANQIPVTWTPAAPNGSTITGYAVQAQVAPSGAITTVNVAGTATSATISGLSNCTAYNLMVTATSGGGSTDSDPVLNVTPRQAPDVPTGPTLTQGVGVGDFSFSWGPSNPRNCGTVSYTVQVVDPVLGALTPMSAGTSTSLAFSTTTPACPYASVNCATPRTWSFSVRATNGGGTSAFTAPVSKTPRIGYIRDSVFVIWSTVLMSQTCISCHTVALGNALVFEETPADNTCGADNTHCPSFRHIHSTPSVLNPGTPTSSFLHTCPTTTGTCTPFHGGTSHPGGLRFNSGSIEDNLILQWIRDGALF